MDKINKINKNIYDKIMPKFLINNNKKSSLIHHNYNDELDLIVNPNINNDQKLNYNNYTFKPGTRLFDEHDNKSFSNLKNYYFPKSLNIDNNNKYFNRNITDNHPSNVINYLNKPKNTSPYQITSLIK